MRSALLQRADDRVEVCCGLGDGQAAEAVVAAELHDDELGLRAMTRCDAVEAVLGGVAADAGVDDVVVVALGVEVALEVVGIALAGIDAVAGGEAVAEADDDGPAVVPAGVELAGWAARIVHAAETVRMAASLRSRSAEQPCTAAVRMRS